MPDSAPSDCRMLDPIEAGQANLRRDELLAQCLDLGARTYGGTKLKLFTGELSPGCIACARGEWSCLYLSRFCARQCFYCPKEQAERDTIPYEGLLRASFPDAEIYARLIDRLGYRGVGLSGGEPFHDFPRLEEFVRTVRARLGRSVYVWVYTSGDGVDGARVARLAQLGLDELRVDLSARGYDLSPLKAAEGRVGRVSVEIPAIPEDAGRVFRLLPELERLGVRHLNLHQLCRTEYNRTRLARRGYTVLRGYAGEQPILESELSALRLVRRALESRLALPVHYCSLEYKLRCQQSTLTLRLATRRIGGVDAVTHAGLMRTVYVPGPRAFEADLRRRLDRAEKLWQRRPELPGLAVALDTLEVPEFRRLKFRVAYWRYSGLSREAFAGGRIESRAILPDVKLWVHQEGPLADFALSGALRTGLLKVARDIDPARSSSSAGDVAFRAFEGLEFPLRQPPPLR